MEVTDAGSVRRAPAELRPWAVIHATDEPGPDRTSGDPTRCRREHVTGPEILARACAERGLPLLVFSSAQVFDGRRLVPYDEAAPVSPEGIYGRTKAEGEARVLSALPSALVVRTGDTLRPLG